MSEWISVEEAAKKYNLKKEYIQLWVDMRVIMSYFKDYKTVVNDESLRGFLKTREMFNFPPYSSIKNSGYLVLATYLCSITFMDSAYIVWIIYLLFLICRYPFIHRPFNELY